MNTKIPQKLFVRDKYKRLEYVITIEKSKNDEDVYSIFASDDKVWCEHVRGSLLFRLINTGNGIKIKNPRKNTTSFRYDEALYLQILLNLSNIHSHHPCIVDAFDENGENQIKLI